MKYIIIMITFLALTSVTYAKSSQQIRAEMLLEGKHLTQRFETLKIRDEAWQERKEFLILDFHKNHKREENLPADEEYARERFENRKKAFYDSLQEREDEISKELSLISSQLELLKERFSHRYGVPLSKKEMFGGRAPKVKDIKRKIGLLKKYLKSTKSWRACLKQSSRFDDSRMRLEMRTDITEKKYNSLSLKLDKKTERNFIALNRLEDSSIGAAETYALDYGYSIPDEVAAKILLENIQKAR